MAQTERDFKIKGVQISALKKDDDIITEGKIKEWRLDGTGIAIHTTASEEKE